MTSRLEPRFGRRAVLCDGAMGTYLYAGGASVDQCCDELSLSRPELVRRVHDEYLKAGAEIIETNTFGANALRLERYGLRDHVAEINRAAVRVARQAVLQHTTLTAAYVAGSVGPLGVRLESVGKTGLEKAREAFSEQIRALTAGPESGVDLLIVETMMTLNEAEQAVIAAHAAAPDIPVIVMVTVDEDSSCLDGSPPEIAAARIDSWGVDGIGCNCSLGPATVLRAIERMARTVTLPLMAMPNAGMPHRAEGRVLYPCSPEGMAFFAQRAVEVGVQFVGGCCGTAPQHIRAMKAALLAREAQRADHGSAIGEPMATKASPGPWKNDWDAPGEGSARDRQAVVPRGAEPELAVKTEEPGIGQF